MKWLCTIAALSCLVLAALAEAATPASTDAVLVEVGKTPIPSGKCDAPDDITLRNGHLAVSFAVSTPAQWGIPKGCILDGAPVIDGQISTDRISFIDFLPNGWSGWPSEWQEVEILREGPEVGQVRVSRDFRGLDVVTTYTLRAGSNRLEASSVIENDQREAVQGLLSGYSLCTREGHLFMPGRMDDEARGESVQDWASGYGPDWAVSLLVPKADATVGGTAWRDLYRVTHIEPGASIEMSGTYIFEPSATIAGAMEAAAARDNSSFGTVRGKVMTSAGAPIAAPTVVVMAAGAPLTWAVGSEGAYSLRLPAGRYQLRALARDHAPSTPVDVELTPGADVEADFNDLAPPGTVVFSVRAGAAGNGNSKDDDARITYQGERPVVHHLGRYQVFTDFHETGTAIFPFAPGRHVFSVSHGGGFLTSAKTVEVEVRSGETTRTVVDLGPFENPAGSGWLCADLHHHSNLSDGMTAPKDLVVSQAAAGLDFTFVSDHDQVDNHAEIAALSKLKGMPFIPSIEVSPSWGHFNLYPLPQGLDPGLDPSETDPSSIFAAAHKAGALIQVNHGFTDSNAYITFHDGGVLPVEFDDGFDFYEINGNDLFDSGDEKAVARAWSSWTDGKPRLLSGGSDTHDIASGDDDQVSGVVRTCAYVGFPAAMGATGAGHEPDHSAADSDTTGGSGAGAAAAGAAPAWKTVSAFREALARGRSYVTLGPVLYPEPVPATGPPNRPYPTRGEGTEPSARGDVTLGTWFPSCVGTGTERGVAHPLQWGVKLEVYAANEIAYIALVADGREARRWDVEPGTTRTTVEHTFKDEEGELAKWVSWVVEDRKERRAYTNPAWSCRP